MKLTVCASALILLLAAVAIYVAVSDSSSGEPSVQTDPIVSAPEWYGSIEKRLMDQLVDLVFQETPFNDAIDQIVNLIGFSIEVKDLEPRDVSQMRVSTVSTLTVSEGDTPRLAHGS